MEENEKQEEIKDFSEKYGEDMVEFEGERIEIDDVFDKKIVIYNFVKKSGSFGDFVVVDAEIETKRVQFLVGSDVVIRQLIMVKEDNNFPITATLRKRHSETSKRDYYTLS